VGGKTHWASNVDNSTSLVLSPHITTDSTVLIRTRPRRLNRSPRLVSHRLVLSTLCCAPLCDMSTPLITYQLHPTRHLSSAPIASDAPVLVLFHSRPTRHVYVITRSVPVRRVITRQLRTWPTGHVLPHHRRHVTSTLFGSIPHDTSSPFTPIPSTKERHEN
jgi:hypothetical protein